MKIKNKVVISKILTLLMIMSMAFGMVFVSEEKVYAGSVEDVIQTYGAEAFGSLLSTDASLAADSDYASVQVTVDGVTKKYYYRKDNEKAIVNKAKSLKGQAQIESLDEYYSLEADVEGASGLVDGLKGPISTFLGILVTFITVFMTVFTALDICYIAFPVFRGKMDEAKSNGTKGVTHQGKNGETKLTFITEDAQFAVINAETAQTGRSAYLIYFKQRVVSFIILAILIFILLTGNINILTNIGVKLASGVLEAISNSF